MKTVDHGVSKPLSTELLFEEMLQKCQKAHTVKKYCMSFFCAFYDEVAKLDMKVIPRNCNLDLSAHKENTCSEVHTIVPLRFHHLPIYNMAFDPAVRNKFLTRNWIWTFVTEMASDASESCADFLSTPLDFKDLRLHMKDFFVQDEGPFNPGKILRSSMVRRMSQKKYYGIGENIVVKYRDYHEDVPELNDDTYCLTVLEYEEGDTEDDDDIDVVILKVRVHLQWRCNMKVEILAAKDVCEYYKVYRTDDRDCSVSFHHSGSDNYDGEISSQINQAMAMTDWRDIDLGA